jgi:integrase
MAHIDRRRTKDGESRYEVRWRAAGRERSKSFARRKDADSFKAKVEGDELVGLVTDPSMGKVTFATYAKEWLASRVVRGHPLSPSTRYGYERLLERNILPALGTLSLRAISPERVRTWYGNVTAEAGHDQAAKSYRLLSAILNTAVGDDRIGRNPCRIKGGGSESAPERPMPTTAEVLALINAMPARYRLVLALAGLGGLRMGEVLGLRLADVDTLRSAVHIRQTAQEIPKLGRVVKDPKSDAGRRTVVLPRQAMDAITAHIKDFGCAATGELITDPRGGPARRPRVSAAWQKAKATVGVGPAMHPHDLRHHAATLMAQMPGITTKELMARIGHSSPRAALIYQHATAERDRAVATFLEARLDEIKPAPPRLVALPGASEQPAVSEARGIFAGSGAPRRGGRRTKKAR